MLLEAFEILQSAGLDEDTFVTDFAIYKVISILTTYIPLIIATFLLSQEYLGEKIVCFAPENFTDGQAEALNEHCWTNGFWVSDGVELVKSLYTQPHRYYPLYLPIQVVLTMTPVIFWNIVTKSQLLAVLRGTEEFLDDLHDLLNQEQNGRVVEKVLGRMKQFHNTCIQACKTTNLSQNVWFRVLYETCLLSLVFLGQFVIFNHEPKSYHCTIYELHPDEIMCTVPTLDLLDAVWTINVMCILAALAINCYIIFALFKLYHRKYQPKFYNNLPYGDTDDFNETVKWDDPWVKNSYLLLTRLFLENNAIMTRAYVLQAMKPLVQIGKSNKAKNDDEGTMVTASNGINSGNGYSNVDQRDVESSDMVLANGSMGDSVQGRLNGQQSGDTVSPLDDPSLDRIVGDDGNGSVRYRLTVATRLRPVTQTTDSD